MDILGDLLVMLIVVGSFSALFFGIAMAIHFPVRGLMVLRGHVTTPETASNDLKLVCTFGSLCMFTLVCFLIVWFCM